MIYPHDLMLEVQAASSLNDVTASASAYFNKAGFDKFAYVFLDLPQDRTLNKSYLSNYPKEWQQHYTSNDYFRIDPIFMIARQRKESFVWGDDQVIEPISAEQKKFFRESGDAGTDQGVSIPVLLPKGGFCLLSLCTKDMSKRELKRYLHSVEPNLIASALTLHQGMMSLREQSPIINRYNLTDAEQETLYWLCQNKTYEDIGLILGLGREGVSERLRKIYRKMDAVGKIDAVKKAIASGLFQL